MQTTFGFFKMATVAMEITKNTKNLKCLELDETFQKFFLTCVHIILRLTNFRMATVARKKRAWNWMKLNRNVVWHVYKWF